MGRRRLSNNAGHGNKPTEPQIIALPVINSAAQASAYDFPSLSEILAKCSQSLKVTAHSADYDPHSEFSATDVNYLIDRVEIAINGFNQTADDIRRDLAIHILTNVRND